MKQYKELDNELLFMIEETSEEAVNSLINKYSNLISIVISKYNRFLDDIGLEDKDLYQEGLLGLLEAINSYDSKRNVQFNTYATRCIENRIKTMLRHNTNKKSYYMNNSISLDNNTDDINLHEIIKENSPTPEEKVLIKEELQEINKKAKSKLTTLEYQVYTLKLKGYKNEEIGNLINKDKKKIETTITRINKKISELKKERE